MKRAKRVLVLTHPVYRPDRAAAPAGTERDVWRALRRLGYVTQVAAVADSLTDFDRVLRDARPDVVFNLLEEFRGEGVYDFHLVSYLEALGIPFTGSNPRGLITTRNKFAVTALANALGVDVPRSSLDAAPTYPAFVKFNREHASRGITRANVVRDEAAHRAARARMRRGFEGELITQEFIVGHEVSVAVWGNARPRALKPWRLHLAPDRVATEKMKFDARYRRKAGVRARAYGEAAMGARVSAHSRKLFVGLDLNGYARFDYRVDQKGRAYLIDVNANPNLARGEDFAASAAAEGYAYEEVVERVLTLGLRYEPRR